MTERMSYSSYLHLHELLASVCPTTSPEDRVTWTAERYFIVCHQTSELWLSQILADLRESARLSQEGAWSQVSRGLWRVSSMAELLVLQLGRLVYLGRADFHRFRPTLEGASGAESEQCLEVLRADEQADIRVIRASLAATLAANGLEVPHRTGSCKHGFCRAAHAAEDVVKVIQRWRRLHVRIASHFVGDMPGTGGSAGVAYLRARLTEAPDLSRNSATSAEPCRCQEK
jgi:tryptophan 2,3-dioxygenase